MAKITFYIPDQSPAKYDISAEEQVTVGRSPDCDITLDHTSVSGHHATIRKIGAGLHVLEDNGSTNGVFLEGEQVSEAPLAHGASITIGSVPAEFEGEDATADAPAPQEQPVSGAADSSAGGGGYGAPVAPIAESSSRPAGFKDMSPVEKIVKNDSIGKVAMILSAVAFVAVIALVLLTVMMSVA